MTQFASLMKQVGPATAVLDSFLPSFGGQALLTRTGIVVGQRGSRRTPPSCSAPQGWKG